MFSWAASVKPSLATSEGIETLKRAARPLASGSVERSSISLVKTALPVAPSCLAMVSGNSESSAANGTPNASARVGSSLPVSSSTLWKISPEASPYEPPRRPVLNPRSAPFCPSDSAALRVAVSCKPLSTSG